MVSSSVILRMLGGEPEGEMNSGVILMQKIYINKILNKNNFELEFLCDSENELELDFSNVTEIRLEDIEKLLDIQKAAVFNEVKIRVENMQPNISRIFEQTGLYKMLNTFGNPPKVKIHKRLGLLLD